MADFWFTAQHFNCVCTRCAIIHPGVQLNFLEIYHKLSIKWCCARHRSAACPQDCASCIKLSIRRVNFDCYQATPWRYHSLEHSSLRALFLISVVGTWFHSPYTFVSQMMRRRKGLSQTKTNTLVGGACTPDTPSEIIHSQHGSSDIVIVSWHDSSEASSRHACGNVRDWGSTVNWFDWVVSLSQFCCIVDPSIIASEVGSWNFEDNMLQIFKWH